MVVVVVAAAGCGPKKKMSPATPDQSVRDAMILVCDAPSRADDDRTEATRSDKIAGHLTDGVGNVKVLTTVEGWKTDGIKRDELEALMKEAALADCKLLAEASG